MVGDRRDIAPERSELEVSLFGPGYGESVILHLGENAWFIVDSCIDPATGDPAPLEYLRQMQIDPATAVQQVIATHWHDDHIRGLGRIVTVCETAEFVCSAALRQNEFLTLVAAYGQRAMMTSPGVKELGVIALFQSDTGVVSIGIVGGTARGIEVNRVDSEGHLW